MAHRAKDFNYCGCGIADGNHTYVITEYHIKGD